MPMGMGYGYYWDPTYVLVIIGALICMIASANVSGTYKKYNRVRNSRNMTGAQVAAQILQEAGLSNIRIEHISGDLTDHYDPSAKVLRLSDSVYGSTSIAAAGVAAHECGHAIQDKVNYIPIRLRNAFCPETITTAAHIPVTHIFHKTLQCFCGLRNFVVVKVLINFFNRRIQTGQKPAVHNRKFLIF